jgi:hypothetical protein
MACPFQTLSISPNSTEAQVLKAWRKLMLQHHPDKADPADEARIHELNAAKEACLDRIVSTRYVQDEQEFVRHICGVLQEKIEIEHDFSFLVGARLHDFMHIRAVDGMEWVLKCAMGDMPFEQRKEDEIPILCKYYDSFIGRENWTDEHNTIMTVLTKYDTFKAKGYGNFARGLGDSSGAA